MNKRNVKCRKNKLCTSCFLNSTYKITRQNVKQNVWQIRFQMWKNYSFEREGYTPAVSSVRLNKSMIKLYNREVNPKLKVSFFLLGLLNTLFPPVTTDILYKGLLRHIKYP